ncbi:hypothetical protein, partial [Streptomyces sp. SID4982]|uniref:hypothetical protein n=1 Tax=Streptomyces sp. SID4982 TaxID=2690291 RepID=UPI00136DD099
MSDDWYPHEQCPHCPEAPTANRLDEHLATVHADLPDCTARYSGDDGDGHVEHGCAMKVAHVLGE